MNKPLFVASAVLLIAVATQAAHAAPAPVLQDFAARQTLNLETPGQAAYRVEVPASVYTTSLRADLGDLRVFNGAGELLPYAFLQLPPPRAEAPAPVRVKLPLFPIHASNASTTTGGGDMNIDLQAGPDGRLRSLHVASGARTTTGNSAIVGYVLDASALKQGISGLRLAWQMPGDDSIASVDVDTSEDLQHWQRLRSGAPLLDLRYGEQRLQRDQVEINAGRVKYLRVSWPQAQALTLTQAEAELTPHAPLPPARAALRWTDTAVSMGSSGEYLFDSGGVPVESLRIALPTRNTVAPLRVFRRNDPGAPWREVAFATSYRLTRGDDEITSPDLLVGRSRDRYWRLLVDQRGGGLGQGVPRISAGWSPQQLMFVARGAAPYTLAYGAGEVSSAAYDAATLLPGLDEEQVAALPPAVPGAAPALAPAQLQAMPDLAADQRQGGRKYLLWSVLIAGVAVLGLMVWQLTAAMQRPRDN